MVNGLYTNRNAHRDFVENALNRLAGSSRNVFIAVAFLTEKDVVDELVARGCHVRLIVRLGFPTNPEALLKVIKNSSVETRFFTDSSFHPKLYIFEDEEALVGSANLTKAGIRTNQEVVVSIPGGDERFIELATLFSDYWQDASVLTEEILKKYKEHYAQYSKIGADISDLDSSVKRDIGHVVFHNIDRGKRKLSKENVFLESYRKTFQECVTAFNKIRVLYESSHRRKINENQIPLRLEIDAFFSFVRETYAPGENTWLDTPIGWGEDQKALVEKCLHGWFNTLSPHLEEVVNVKYPRLTRVFSTANSVMTSSDDELFEALLAVYSFHDRLRFFPGGLKTLREQFFARNDGKQIRESLSYLVFGVGDVTERMANLIFQPKYKLNEFGQANVQELIGWSNKEDYPVINGRTTKILRYFGFDVRQLS
jgi:HKD family nuclease